MANHVRDHAVLHPAGDEDSNAALDQIRTFAFRRLLFLRPRKTMCETEENRNEIVYSAEKKRCGQQSQQDGQNRRSSGIG